MGEWMRRCVSSSPPEKEANGCVVHSRAYNTLCEDCVLYCTLEVFRILHLGCYFWLEVVLNRDGMGNFVLGNLPLP